MKKEKEQEKDNRIIYITIGTILILAIVIVALIINKKNNPESNIDIEKTYTLAAGLIILEPNEEVEELRHSKVITSYEEYNKYFVNDDISSEDFDNYNYAVIALQYDDCGERNLTPTSYGIDGTTITVTVYFDSSCGLCAPIYDYYALKVDKNITDANFSIKSNPRNKVHCDPNVAYKPIIYFYPEETTDVNVKLGYEDKIRVSYPKYENGWNVRVREDGTIESNGKEYYALYWEGANFDAEVTNEGFVISGEETASFLEEKLELLGLNEREANEFIIYWLPKLESNKYNYIRFETNEYVDEYMPLEITPTPDNVIRVYMVYKPLNELINVKEQTINTPSRNGFTVVEWGGSQID